MKKEDFENKKGKRKGKGNTEVGRQKEQTNDGGQVQRTQKVNVFTKLNTVVANVRGIKSLGARQQLAKQWEKYKVEVALLREMQRNTGGIDQGSQWGNFVCFYSTGISPKIIETQEKTGSQRCSRC